MSWLKPTEMHLTTGTEVLWLGARFPTVTEHACEFLSTRQRELMLI
jgi:hypothetical protein